MHASTQHFLVKISLFRFLIAYFRQSSSTSLQAEMKARNRQTTKAAAVGARLGVKAGTARASDPSCKHKQIISANALFLFLLTSIACIYTVVVYAFYEHEDNSGLIKDRDGQPDQLNQQRMTLRRGTNNEDTNPANTKYTYWRDLVVRLASMPAKDALLELETKDPFGTRQFEKKLLEQETKLGRLLDHTEILQLFSCPSSRITLPDQRDLQKARDFRDAKPGTFLFFQHLRKAGGTHFCSLAKANLPKNNVAAYYCMPDMKWSGNKHAGMLHSYNNTFIMEHMKDEKMRIAGNEWDWFDVEHHFQLPAVLATSFRKPLDRALSQFRFECIEDRGCKIKDIHEWWDKRKDLYNVYTMTFSDAPKFFGKLKAAYEDTDPNSAGATKRAEMAGKALDTVAKFNVVLAMEFLAYAGPQVDRVLGFHDTSPLTHRVRPHIGQAKRDDGQEVNNLGAAGITKASWDPEKYLDKEQYQKMSQHLVLDIILTDAARRMFLERLVCTDLAE